MVLVFRNNRIRILDYVLLLLLCFTSLIHGHLEDPSFKFVIDILSENVEFSTFLRILQRKGCIEYLNTLRNFTLFAPVNSAFINISTNDESFLNDFTLDNYLLLDKEVTTSQFSGVTKIFTTKQLEFPFSLSNYGQEFWINSDIEIVEKDLISSFQNAVVHGVSDMIKTPPNILDLIEDLNINTNFFDNYIQILHSLMTSSTEKSIFYNNSILIPTDETFTENFNKIELDYITNKFNSLNFLDGKPYQLWYDDLEKLLKNLILDGIIGGTLADKSYKNLLGYNNNLISDSKGREFLLNDTDTSINGLTNLVFNSGLVHGFVSLTNISDPIKFTVEKYLHGLNASHFVKELYFRHLENLIQNNDKKQTLFIPHSSIGESNGYSKSNILYHFSGENIYLENDFNDELHIQNNNIPITKMYESKFCSSNKRLGGNCQRLKIQKSISGNYFINEKNKILTPNPIRIGNTLIYIISENLDLPGDLITSISPFYHCSNSLNFLNELDLLDLPSNNKGYTLFLPCFDSWNEYKLNYDFLKNNRKILNDTIRSLIIDNIVYTNFVNETIETTDLLGNKIDLQITRKKDHDSRNKDLTLNLSSFNFNITLSENYDVLFDKGVIHPINELILPKNIKISILDLLKTTEVNEVIDFLQQFPNIEELLFNSGNYSILVPTSASLEFGGFDPNVPKSIENFLKLHLIKMNDTNNNLLDDCLKGEEIITLQGSKLKCREPTSGVIFLSLENNPEKEVRILKKGCSNDKNLDKSSCVYMLDKPISLKWLNQDKQYLRLPGVAFGVGIIIGSIIIIILFGSILGIHVLISNKKKKAIENEEGTTEPLLGNQNGNDENNNRRYGTNLTIPIPR